jgi:hypothetical protein
LGDLKMSAKNSDQQIAVRFRIWIGLKLEIPPGQYPLDGFTIEISYPSCLPSPAVIKAQNGNIILFDVAFSHRKSPGEEDPRVNGSLNERLRDEAYDIVGKFLTSIKLVAAGTAWAKNARQIGETDVLWGNLFVDGTLEQNIGSLKSVAVAKRDPFFEVYRVKSEEYRGSRFALAIRLTRCIELIESSFHTEAFLAAFAVLDDTVQDVIRVLMKRHGTDDEEIEKVLRGIRSNRLRVMLGTTLKDIADFRLEVAWPSAFDALAWLNTTRNQVAHAGRSASRSEASAALYVVECILTALIDSSCLDAEIPSNFKRDIHYACATARPRQPWFPDVFEVQEAMKIVFPAAWTK